MPAGIREAGVPGRALRVLLVEDSEVDARWVGAVLEGWEGSVETLVRARSLGEGLEQLQDEAFGLILLDLGLPDSTDLETVRRARQVSGETPIVVLTAQSSGAMGEAAIKLGAQDFVTKGHASPAALRRAIRFAVERQQLLTQVQATERRHHRLLDRVRDPVCLLDGEYRLLYVNGALARLLRRPPSELVGESFLALLAPERVAAIARDLDAAVRGERRGIEAVLRADPGLERRVAFAVSVCGDGTYECVGEERTAILDPQAAEEAKRAQWREARSVAPEGSVIINPFGVLEEVNLAFCELVNASQEALVGRPFADLLPREAAAGFQALLEHYRGSGDWRESGRGERGHNPAADRCDPAARCEPRPAGGAGARWMLSVSNVAIVELSKRSANVAGSVVIGSSTRCILLGRGG